MMDDDETEPRGIMGTPHGRAEDAYALFVGTVLIALGLVLLSKAGLVTGGVVGLGLLLSYLTGLPVGLAFTLVNLPLLAATARPMGWRFLVKTLIVNAGLYTMTMVAPRLITIAYVDRAGAAIVGGSVIGMGLLALARHGAGAGGSSAIVLWLYRSRGWNAGRSQMIFDGGVLLLALPVLSAERLLWSLVGLAAMAGILFAWHRPGRYTGY